MQTAFLKPVSLAVFCLLLSIVSNLAYSLPPQDANQPAYLKTIPPDKLKEDLDFLFKSIEEIHPNMYAYTTKEEFSKLRDDLYRQTNEPMTGLEFYKAVAPVVTAMENGHTFIMPPQQAFADYLKNGGKIFPLRLVWEGGDKVFLDACPGPVDLPIGAEVLTIDNQNAAEFLAGIARYFPAEGKSYSVSRLPNSFAMYLWLEKGSRESLQLQIKTGDGKTSQFYIKPLTLEEIKNYKKTKINQTKSTFTQISKYTDDNNADWSYYSYYYSPDYNTGLIQFDSFSDLEKFKMFVKNTFGQIQKQNVPNLIIDLRDNPGGDSRLGDELLKHLTNKSVRQFEKYQVRLSYELLKKEPGLKNMYPKAAIGSIVTVEAPFLPPVYVPSRFKGKTFVLIDAATASSAESFAATVKHFRIGTLIGRETEDTLVSYGECVMQKLPNSDLDFSVACKRFVDAGGKEDGHGVIPDYEVRQKPEDTVKGVDTALQFTLNLIKDPNSVSLAKQKAN